MAERGGFAELLKALRDKAGLSQNGLAERSGVAVSTIRQFEYGMREPTYGTLVKLAKGLGVSLAAFDPGEAPTMARRSAGQEDGVAEKVLPMLQEAQAELKKSMASMCRPLVMERLEMIRRTIAGEPPGKKAARGKGRK